MTTPKARIQKHRAKLKAADCLRLEVVVHRSVIEGVQELAKREGMSRSDVVAYAVIEYYQSRNGSEPVGP